MGARLQTLWFLPICNSVIEIVNLTVVCFQSHKSFCISNFDQTTSDRLKCIYIFALPFRFWKYLFHRDLIVLLKYIFYSIYLWRWYLTENSLFVFTVVGDEVSIKIMLSDLTQPGFLLQPYMVLFKALQLWLYSSKTALSIFYIQSVTRTVYKRQGKKMHLSFLTGNRNMMWISTCVCEPVCSQQLFIRKAELTLCFWFSIFPPQPKRK